MLKKKVFGSSLFFLNALVLLFILTKSERILQQFNNETNQYPPGAEICSAKGQMMAYLFDVGLDIPLRVVQNEATCVHFFLVSIDYSNNQPSQYLIFEVEFTNFTSNPNFRPRLIGKSSPIVPRTYPAAPMFKFTQTGIFIDATKRDDNGILTKAMKFFIVPGYMNRKSYHNIVIPPSQVMLLSQNNTRIPTNHVFAMYKYYDQTLDSFDASVQYTVKARFSSTFPCPKDCSGHGYCDLNLDQCVCEPGYFDLDCSVNATMLSAGFGITRSVPSQAFIYFYIDTTTVQSGLSLSSKKGGGIIDIFLLFTSQNYSLPNFEFYDGKSSVLLSNQEQFGQISQSSIRGSKRLMIGVYNSYTEPVSVVLRYEINNSGSESSLEEVTRSAIMYAMIGISSMLLVLWGIFSIVKCNIQKTSFIESVIDKVYRDAEAARRATLDAGTGSVSYLTGEELDRYFPKTEFRNLKSSFSQPMCSICLDDFAKDTICRQLTCEHVYHGPCIDLWLSNHEVKSVQIPLFNVNKNCPNCKKEMTRQAIEEYLANPNKPTFENKLHLPAEGEAPKHEDTYVNHTTTNNRYRRSDSGMSEINSSSACLKTNKTPREEFHYNNYNGLDASIQNYQPEMIVEFEDVQEARQSRVPIRQINATVQKVIQRSPDYNQR